MSNKRKKPVETAMPTCIKLPGTATTDRGTIRNVECFVRYVDAERYREMIADYFQYYLKLDREIMRNEYPDHFRNPRNVAIAILTYHYFRQQGELFSDSTHMHVGIDQIPARRPDASDNDFAVWIEAKA